MKAYHTYYQRGKCSSCGDILWTSSPQDNVYCKCTQASIKGDVLTNVESITDQEQIDYILNESHPGTEVVLINGSA